MAEDSVDQSKPKSPRPLGRPRREDIDAKVLNATFEVLGELGYQRMSVADVALRAGVGRATVYRRWPTKKQLVSAAVGSLATGYTAGDTEDLKAGMADLTKNLLHRGLDSPAGQALPQFIAEMATNPDFFDLFSEAVIAPRRIVMVDSLNKAKARRELPESTDPDLLIDLIAGFLLYRIFVARQTVTDELVERVVDVVFDGAKNTAAP